MLPPQAGLYLVENSKKTDAQQRSIKYGWPINSITAPGGRRGEVIQMLVYLVGCEWSSYFAMLWVSSRELHNPVCYNAAAPLHIGTAPGVHNINFSIRTYTRYIRIILWIDYKFTHLGFWQISSSRIKVSKEDIGPNGQAKIIGVWNWVFTTRFLIWFDTQSFIFLLKHIWTSMNLRR